MGVFKKKRLSKRGQSAVIGYVLLIVLAITMSIIIYQQLKGFVPREADECSDGVSLMINSYIYDCDDNQLILNLKNNGRFDTDGFLLKASTDADTNIATTGLGLNDGEYNEPFLIGEEKEISVLDVFDLKFIEIIPYVLDKDGGRLICSDARIKQKLSCASECAGMANGDLCDNGNGKCYDELCYQWPACNECKDYMIIWNPIGTGWVCNYMGTDKPNATICGTDGICWSGICRENLVANGEFDIDSSWIKGTGWSIDTNLKIAKVYTYTSGTNLEQSIEGVGIYKKYRIKLDVTFNDFTGIPSVIPKIGGTSGTTITQSGTGIIKDINAQNSDPLRITAIGTPINVNIDNVKCYDIT